MKFPSSLTLLIFIHLTSALPIPNMLSDCSRYGTCRDALLDTRMTGNVAPDQYIPSGGEGASVDAPDTTELDQDVATPKDIASLIATAIRVEGMKENSRHDILISPSDDDMRVLSWCQQMSRQAWRNSREYSELLVIGIVILFLLALTAWESAWQSSRVRKSLKRSRKRGPIYLSDDEGAIPFRSVLIDENGDFWKEKPSRWSNGKPCCTEHANSPTRITCDDLSTTELISKCVRGVCEL